MYIFPLASSPGRKVFLISVWSNCCLIVIFYCITGKPGRPGRAFDGQPGQPGERGHTGRLGRRGHAGLRGPPGVCLTSGCAQDRGTSGSPQQAQRRQRSRPQGENKYSSPKWAPVLFLCNCWNKLQFSCKYESQLKQVTICV